MAANCRDWVLGVLVCQLCSMGCAPLSSEEDVADSSKEDSPQVELFTVREMCGTADVFVLPVPDFRPGSYAGRTFLNPENHTGQDHSAPEGTPIHAIGNGIIKVYRPSEGYGELVVVIEHDLGRDVAFRNGNGEITTTRSIISIYGHLRKSERRGGEQLGWRVGDCVHAGDIIGYVNDDPHNGDGDVHVHGGIRLMSAAEAATRDPEAWFRGYDDGGRWRRDFAAMSEVVSGMLDSVRQHPDGALVKIEGDPDIYLLEDGRRRVVENELVWRDERFWTAGNSDGEWHRVAIVSEEELDCYSDGSPIARGVRRRLVRCRDGDFLRREDNLNRRRIPVASVSREFSELVRSWGFDEDELMWDEEVCSGPESFDPLYLRDGTLVREDDQPAVYFITSHGVARLVASWDLFIAMGYQANDIQWVPPGTLRTIVREIQRDRPIDWGEARRCVSDAGPEGGGTGECVSADEVCNNSDDNCDGDVDEDFNLSADPSNCGACSRSCASGEYCSSGICTLTCTPSSELCNTRDDDCDGHVDEDWNLDWDGGNCGRCGNNCFRPNSHYACEHGVCVVDSCDLGWASTDGNLGNGCECEIVAETCNGSDDDCDGLRDESLTRLCRTDCGSGTETCSFGSWIGCTAPRPSSETCNTRDDDCDGSVDETFNLATDSRNCGFCGNVCSPGQICSGGRCMATCTPSSEICDGRDNDCDGLVDEIFFLATDDWNCGRCGNVCGSGRTCRDGVCVSTCSSSPEVCDFADNDCDGVVDDGVRNACNNCGPVPSEVCDGADNDCDGLRDETFNLAADPRNCGRCGNVCASGGYCADGTCVSSCIPSTETCNGIDDDCDGAIDDGIVCSAGTGSGTRTVRILFCTPESGNFYSDFPFRTPVTGGICFDRTYASVRPATYRMNADYAGGTAWEWNEWPAGTIWSRNGATPRAWIDGVESAISCRHDDRIPVGVGANCFLEVR